MTPDRDAEIAEQILALLGLYWTADDPAELRKAQGMIWLDVLGGFEPEIVRSACREWSSFQTRRPTPADIRRLCAEAQEAHEARLRLTARRELPAEIAALWERDPPGIREAMIRAREESYRKAAEWREAQARAGLPITGPTAPPQRKVPQWILDRDAARAEAKRQALALDQLDGRVERFMANLVKRVPAEPEHLDAEAAA
jgi:hypothetical protein